MPKVGKGQLFWVPSPSAGVVKQHITISVGGKPVAYQLGAGDAEFALDVNPGDTGSFKITTFDANGSIDSVEFTFSAGNPQADPAAPVAPALQPATGLGFKVVQWVDVPDGQTPSV